ncbi:MAG TPA: NADH-quinone oxidoreductase subunit NuoG [Bryobacteraceae bacterium]|nr:NADH-quinone oxidoreductase subunit NuoG [Bryobacteraceae bacterium]
MADLVKFTIDGKELEVPAGTLVIEAAKQAGIEIPSFCYYEGYSLQAACRMCLVEVEKMPKMQVACTLPAGNGMVVHTDSEQVRKARKYTLEFLLTNHPLDCPVCDKGGECELQDMVFRYGAGESRFTETKLHVDEQQWSPVVFYDGPRCILCFRCVRACDEGMGVGALGVINRGAVSLIAPNKEDHLECDECGQCIDICPVGALTSGTYRYQTRPWEMEHIGTICTHCSNGCKTTLGVRNGEIVRGNNRDRSGINGEFLCVKGRYAFDFYNHPERITAPMVRVNGKLEEVSWSKALATVASKFGDIKARGGKFGVVGSNHTTNEENFYLQRFVRECLGSNNIDHHRTGDITTLIDALSGTKGRLANSADFYERKAFLIIGADLALEQPFMAFQIRANHRHHGARVYTVTPGKVREDDYSVKAVRAPKGSESDALPSLRDALAAEPELVIVFGDSIRGADVRRLVEFGESLGIPVSYCALLDYSNSRGAIDMGLVPELLPGYRAAGASGLDYREMLAATDLDAFWAIGANPLKEGPLNSKRAFVVVQDMFLTETAQRADVVLPAASAYEKSGTVTNVFGEVQRLTRAASVLGAKPDLEIIGQIAKEMGFAGTMGPWLPDRVFNQIQAEVKGYKIPLPLITLGAQQTMPLNGRVGIPDRPDRVWSAHDNLFTSGTLGRYSKILNSVLEKRLSGSRSAGGDTDTGTADREEYVRQ